MSEVVRKRSRVVAIIRQFVAGAMPQHVRVHRERQLGGFANPLDHPQEPRRGHWRPGFGHEHIGALALQLP
jgi:hypothetical protein